MPITEYPITAFEDEKGLSARVRGGLALSLEQEGLVNDLSFHVNRLRREREYHVRREAELVIACGPELWWAIYFNEAALLESTKTSKIVFVDHFERDLFYQAKLSFNIPVALHTRYTPLEVS
ncbi:hypothetical protein SEA_PAULODIABOLI_173 [Microbacterium phage PauloDiaboli]|nr:hypothetical protein SEA_PAULODIABOLI_173 [Microbacterium phage PauloDiaboli]QWY83986.1 hypothetical protein SEA_A3WALLY_173 [Microbacterium phage A3Wally]